MFGLSDEGEKLLWVIGACRGEFRVDSIVPEQQEDWEKLQRWRDVTVTDGKVSLTYSGVNAWNHRVRLRYPERFPDESLRDLVVAEYQIYATRSRTLEIFTDDIRTFGGSSWDQRARTYSHQCGSMYVDDRHVNIPPKHIGIVRKRADGKEEWQVFTCAEIYNEIKSGAHQLALL